MSGPYVWGESKYLGTPQEEFDIATGYWKKWQRCKEEREELVEAAKEVCFLAGSDGVNARLARAIQKAEGT